MPSYLIDGYNLIFSMLDSEENLQSMREKFIHSLQKQFAKRKLKGEIVFDGKQPQIERAYPSPVTIVYAPKGMTADQYIIERASMLKEVTVVTNDKGLARQVKRVMPNREFISWLYKKKIQENRPEMKETKANIERYLKIFEDRLGE